MIHPTDPEAAMAASASMKDNDPSKVKHIKDLSSKVMNEIEQVLSDHEQERLQLADQVSKPDAINAAVDNVKNLLSELPEKEFHPADIIAAIDDVKKEIEHESIIKNFKVRYDKLIYQLRICLLYLSIFPEREVIRKRPIIYWWIANGLIEPLGDKTAEEVGEDIFEKLLQLDLVDPIKPCDKGNIPIVNKFRIHPSVRRKLIEFASEDNLFDFDDRGILGDKIALSGHACLPKEDDNSKKLEKLHPAPNSGRRDLKTIFNVGEQYLFLDPTWIADSKKIEVLQLGCWQESPSHHIQVERGDFLSKALTGLKLLKYLSLRGISKITELPESVLEFTNLEILDLKACHNLVTLPADISALHKLTHFDISHCHLLEGMPKGLEKLTSLQALKGFVIAQSKRTKSRIGGLKSLENLKIFSILIGNEAEIEKGEFEKLEELKAVKRLKISWALVSEIKRKQIMEEDFRLPPSLEKLVLEALPHHKLPGWLMPGKLKSLKKLYLKGGNLKVLDSGFPEWEIEILRLWYMKSAEINESTAEKWFPYRKCKREINHAEGYGN